RVYQVGGAQAIAAMAYGTETLPKVDKIVGAGNLFVALAKQQLYGVVGMDGLAGPTETLIIADDSANPEWIAADLCAQAEHDPMATAILLTPSLPLARQVRSHLQTQIQALPRHQIIRQSLSQRGGIVVTADLETAVQAANAFAPEHLCLAVKAPEVLAQQVRHAGGIFLGESSPEVLGDYVAGPSHVMPTGGTARFASPLNVLDFVKITSIVGVDRKTGLQLYPAAATIATMESLQAHANAARVRLEEGHE
ncbi:MAG: histidinol dehydrogenase, partial [Calditrichaeota bacterium]